MIHSLALSLKAKVCVQWRVLTLKGYSLHFCCILNTQAGTCCCKKGQATEAHQQMEQKGTVSLVDLSFLATVSLSPSSPNTNHTFKAESSAVPER